MTTGLDYFGCDGALVGLDLGDGALVGLDLGGGAFIGLDLDGALGLGRGDALGFSSEDLGTILKFGSEAATTAMSMKEKADREAKTKADEDAAVRAAVAADVDAVAAAAAAARVKRRPEDDPSARALAEAATAAGAELSEGGQRRRLAEARRAAAAAAKNAASHPKDAAAAAMARAWTGALPWIQAGGSRPPAGSGAAALPLPSEEGFWSRKLVGPVPRWGGAAAVATVLGGLAWRRWG